MALWQEYFTPTTIAEALQIRSRFGHDAEFVAGGTDLILDLQQGGARYAGHVPPPTDAANGK